MPSAPLPRKILIPLLSTVAGNAAVWGLLFSGVLPDPLTDTLTAAAVTVSVISAIGWAAALAVQALRDGNSQLLIGAVVEASRRAAKAKTGPLRRVK